MYRVWVVVALAALIGALVWVSTRSKAPPEAAPPGRLPAVTSPDSTRSITPSGVAAPERTVVPAAPDVVPPPTAASLTVVVIEGRDSGRVTGAEVSVVGMRALMQAFAAAGTSMHQPRGRSIRAATALRAITDADGEARLDVPAGSLMIEARHAGRWGFVMQHEPAPDGRVTITIGPDRELQVQVVNQAGAPQSGVPVVLRRERTRMQMTSTELPDGIARFEHFQRRLQQGDGWHATFGFPLRIQPTVPVDAQTPPSPPQRLVLPPIGRLRIDVRDGNGEVPRLEGISLHVEVRGDELLWPDGPWSQPALESGSAIVPWLGLGLEVTVTARRRAVELASVTVAGPRNPGDTTVCELVLADAFARTVRGRFVLADGTPWPSCNVGAHLFMWPITGDYPTRQQIAVLADGRFALEIEHRRPPGGSRIYQLSGPHPNASGQVKVELELNAEVPPEGLDLGDVIFDHGPLLVGGTVLGPDRRPLNLAYLRLAHCTEVNDKEFWPIVPTSGTFATSWDGRFRLHLRRGESDPGRRLRLHVSCDGYLDSDGLDVGRGTTDAVVLMTAAGAVAGSFAFGDGVTKDDLLAVLSGAALPDEDVIVRMVAVSRDGTFAADGIPAGTYTFKVRRRGVDGRLEDEPVVAIEDVQVVARSVCRDERLQRIPIAALCTTLRIEVVDADSTPQPHAEVVVLGETTGPGTRSDLEGVCRVRTEHLPVDLEVRAFGCRPRTLYGVHNDQRVVMQRGIPVVLRCGTRSNGTDPTWQLGVHLYGVDGNGVARRMTYGTALPWQKRYFDADGKLALPLPGPGVYECALQVYVRAGGVGRGGQVELPQNPRITVVESTSTQTFDLNVPADAVRRAVERAAR